MESESKKKRSRIEQGSVKCSASDLLCANEFRDVFLVRGDPDRYRVSVNELKQKYIGLLFIQLSLDGNLPFLRVLKQVYAQLLSKYPGAFEIVFVPFSDRGSLHKYKPLFDVYLNQMPWLAVPYDDSAWRKHILDKYEPKLNLFKYKLLLFDPSGRLLEGEDGISKLVARFGPDYYPFTEAREDELIRQYLAPIRAKSLIALLGASGDSSWSPRDYLISYGDGDDDYKKVPISQLNGKVLGLLFYCGFKDERNLLFIEQLNKFRLLSKDEFQIVLVNVYFDDCFQIGHGFQNETAFRDFLRERPWMLALPFEDEKIRSLYYTLATAHQAFNPLAIIGGGDDCFSDPYGHEVIQQYGYEAYPFTQDMAVQIEKNKLFQVKLNDILKAIGDKYLVCIRRSKMKKKPISWLENKRVIIYVGSLSCLSDIKKLEELHGMDNSFEVLFLRNNDDRENLDNLDLSKVPKWINFPTNRLNYIFLERITKTTIFEKHFIAFDENGKLMKIGHMELLEDDGCDTSFPFMTDKTFDKDFKMRLLHEKKWHFKDGDLYPWFC